ncbi:hypothetical protein T01_16083 [Trichinella spiralis]|uniref:Uncharacterized protein n=1 Tax=Trichinella spiralis TaxID=6334 RepID=A0A0V1AU34_TRISP|nr:hypothetical protein T01_16083 [Trichinella spiralis]
MNTADGILLKAFCAIHIRKRFPICRSNYRLTAALGNYSFLVFHFNEYGCVYLAEDTIKSMTRGWIISRLYVCFIPHHQHAISQQFDATAPMMSLCEKR